MNIITYGVNELFITGYPQISFFKMIYRRHTNFAKESIELPGGDMNFGDEITIPFPKIADLINDTYIQLEIPNIHLLKTDLASDLTDDEHNILSSPFDIPLTDEQLAIVDDYQTIIDFLKINMLGYRQAVKNMDVINQTTQVYVDSILSVLVYYDSLDISFRDALNRALEYENSINNRKNDCALEYRHVDIREILNTKIVDPDAYDDFTVNEVFLMVKKAKDFSVKLKNYYFQKVKEKNKLQTEYSSKYAKFAWVAKLGHSIIDYIDIEIGGERIDRHDTNWIDLWHELTSHDDQQTLYNKMIGNVSSMTNFDRNEKPKFLLTIPLSFWFCKRISSAFPIVALQYSTISLKLKLKKIDECAYVETLPKKDNDGNDLDIEQLTLSDIWDNMGYSINCSLLTDYIYLDKAERKRFAQTSHEYLVETVQRMTIDEITNKNQSNIIDFNGPSKEIIWLSQKTKYVENDSFKNKLNFVYSINADGTDNPIANSKLLLNGHVRFDNVDKNYHNYIQSYMHHTRTPIDGINLYSFSLYPEEFQPSGECNFTRITSADLSFVLDDNMFKYYLSDTDPNIEKGSDEDELLETTVNLKFYSQRYEVLRIIGGLAGFSHKYIV